MSNLAEDLRTAAFNFANSCSLEELAEMVADSAPFRRGKWSTHAKVPWSLIYAIRIKMVQEDQ